MILFPIELEYFVVSFSMASALAKLEDAKRALEKAKRDLEEADALVEQLKAIFEEAVENFEKVRSDPFNICQRLRSEVFPDTWTFNAVKNAEAERKIAEAERKIAEAEKVSKKARKAWRLAHEALSGARIKRLLARDALDAANRDFILAERETYQY